MHISLFFAYICLIEIVHCLYEKCDYYQNMVKDKNYNIFSPGYPKLYEPGLSCRWVAKSPLNTKIYLSCSDFYIPASEDCWYNSLGISKTGREDLEDVVFYCGKGSFDFETDGNEIYVVLLTYPGKGGAFFCNVTAKDSNDIYPIPKPAPAPTPAPCTCGHKNSIRIVGGSETGVNEYPMMAGLVDGNTYALFCGGTIISENFVLTAAHCLAKPIPKLGVLVGDHDISTGRETDSAALYRSKQTILHPQYNDRNQQNDIALVKTEKPIVFSLKVGPVCLPFKNAYSDFRNEEVQVLGWGMTSFGGSPSSKLLHAPLNVEPIAACRNVYGSVISTKQLCTYKENQDACQSDSGGPLLWINPQSKAVTLLGIVSYGIGCATKNPSVNTRVASYLDWIKSATGENYCVL